LGENELADYWQGKDEREPCTFGIAVDLQRAAHSFYQRANDGQTESSAREAKLHTFRWEAVAEPFQYFVRNARARVLDPEFDVLCGNLRRAHRDRAGICVPQAVGRKIEQRLLNGGLMPDPGVVVGKLNAERNPFLFAHRLHDGAHGMHRLANREGHGLALNQAVAAGRRDQIRDGRAEPEGGAVDETQLPVPNRVGRRSLGATKCIYEEKYRAEWRANVVRNRDDSVRAIGAGKSGNELAPIGVSPRLLGLVELEQSPDDFVGVEIVAVGELTQEIRSQRGHVFASDNWRNGRGAVDRIADARDEPGNHLVQALTNLESCLLCSVCDASRCAISGEL